MGGVSGQTTQTAKTYTGTINSRSKLVASDSSNNEIISITTPQAANYLYFNYKSSFSITIDGTEITLSDATSNQGGPGVPGGQGGPGGPSVKVFQVVQMIRLQIVQLPKIQPKMMTQKF